MANSRHLKQGVRLALAAMAVSACAAEVAAAKLPKEYQRLQWIESNGKQFLYLGTLPTTGVEMEISVGQMSTTANAIQTIFSQGQNAWNNTYHMNLRKTTYWNSAAWQYGTTDNLVGTYKAGDDIRISVTSERVVIDNGTSVQTFDKGMTPSDGPFYLLANTRADLLPASLKLYGCTIKENGVVIHDFVPCVRTSDQRPGVFDLVTNDFRTNWKNENPDQDFKPGPPYVSGAGLMLILR